MNHLAIGALLPWLLAVGWWLSRKALVSPWFFVIFPLLMTAGAIWAVVPDIPRLLGNSELYFTMHRDPQSNIYLWHYTIDLLQYDVLLLSIPFWTPVLAAMVASMPIMALLTLRRRETS